MTNAARSAQLTLAADRCPQALHRKMSVRLLIAKMHNLRLKSRDSFERNH